MAEQSEKNQGFGQNSCSNYYGDLQQASDGPHGPVRLHSAKTAIEGAVKLDLTCDLAPKPSSI